MIAHNLSLGKRVLFVAEKMAALDVVYRRLEKQGLADFCLEVHSHKSSKTEILQQLDRAWDTRGDHDQAHWESETTRLKILRDHLNTVCARLHHRHPNGWTVHQAIGRVTRDHHPSLPSLSWASGTVHAAEALDEMREIARRLDLNHEAFADALSAFSIIEQTEWSHGWQESVLAMARAIPVKIAELQAARDRLLQSCQLTMSVESTHSLELLHQLATTILKTHGGNLAFAFAADLPAKLEAASEFIALLAEYRKVESRLSVRYAEDGARNVGVDDIQSQWTAADGKFWILAKFARKKVAKALATQGERLNCPPCPPTWLA